MKTFNVFSALPLTFVAAALAIIASAPVGAQEEMDDEVLEGAAPIGVAPLPLPPQGVQILEVNDENLQSLLGLNNARRADAISMGASAAALRANTPAWQALAIWVRDGGVVFLHSDAARLFGFQTTQARPADNRAPGQLFGRARAALPFAAHPLLLSGVASRGVGGGDLPALGGSTRLPALGVQTVFYQLDAGDHLVIAHPAGTPLLRVTDASGATNAPLYAAAIAPFGKGWAIVVPRLVEQNRADGALFVQNLMRFVQSSSGAANELFDPPLGQPVARARAGAFASLPASLIELASQTASDGGDLGVLAAPWNEATAPVNPAVFDDPQKVFQPAAETRLVLSGGEVALVRTALATAIADATPAGETLKGRFRALAFLLRARLELQKGDLQGATGWLQSANEISPNSAEVLLWRGALAASQAQDITLDSPTRARLLGDAVQSWSRVLNAPSLLETTTMVPTISGIPTEAIQSWIAAATRAGQLTDAEPPLVTVLGRPGRLVVLRHFPDDPTLRLAVPAGDLLARASNFMGWDVEAEEILIFPDTRYYAAYSSAARVGSRQIAFNPLAQLGNVVDNRILMVSQNSTTVFVPGPPPRFVPLGSAIPETLGRLHAQVLVNALAEGGTPAPAWMQLGLMSLSGSAVVGGLTNNSPVPAILQQALAAGVLLSPDQFRNANIEQDRTGAVEAQARRLMIYFYARFGAGAVAETLQRLGSGQTADNALLSTTQMTEIQFFVAWRQAELGN